MSGELGKEKRQPRTRQQVERTTHSLELLPELRDAHVDNSQLRVFTHLREFAHPRRRCLLVVTKTAQYNFPLPIHLDLHIFSGALDARRRMDRDGKRLDGLPDGPLGVVLPDGALRLRREKGEVDVLPGVVLALGRREERHAWRGRCGGRHAWDQKWDDLGGSASLQSVDTSERGFGEEVAYIEFLPERWQEQGLLCQEALRQCVGESDEVDLAWATSRGLAIHSLYSHKRDILSKPCTAGSPQIREDGGRVLQRQDRCPPSPDGGRGPSFRRVPC